ncbi:MAG: histidine kinase, partial [bacterium]|nr:histidine kinase [bacterium]
MKKLFYLYMFILLSPVTVFSTEGPAIVFDNISLEDGLSQSSVTSITMDRKGFIWFGTQDGLNRYDGFSFTVFKFDPTVKTSISGNHVRVLCRDQKRDVLWLGTDGNGLNKFDMETEAFSHYRNIHGDSIGISHNSIYCIHQDKEDIFWVGTWGGGLNRFNPLSETFVHYRYSPDDPHSISHDIVRAILEEEDGTFWVGTYGGGLNRFDREKKRFIRCGPFPGQGTPNAARIMSIYRDKQGVLWMGTDGGGLACYSPESGEFIFYRHNPKVPDTIGADRVRSIHEDKTGRMWLGTFGGGLNYFDRSGKRFFHYRRDQRKRHSLAGNEILSIYEDNTEMMWIGTLSGGVSKLDLLRKKFKTYRTIPGTPAPASPAAPPSPAAAKTRTFYDDSSGFTWIGTNGYGMYRWDRKSGSHTHFQHDPENPQSLANNRVFSLLEDVEAKILWVATFGGGLDKLDLDTGVFSHYPHKPGVPGTLSHNRVRDIRRDSAGFLWLALWDGGVNRFDPKTGTARHYRFNPDKPDSISDDNAYCLHMDVSGVLWVGTVRNGLNRYNKDTDNFTRFQQDISNPQSLSHNSVYCIYENPKTSEAEGILWIGTGGKGLNKFDTKNNKWRYYGLEHGMANDVVYGILEDERGNLWLSTNLGISKFNPKTETFNNYDIEDGLQGNEFTGGAYYRSGSGEMFFGGINGFNTFFPGEIKNNPYIAPVMITGFNLFNKPMAFNKAFYNVREVSLSYKDNFISFDFVTLNYRAPEKSKYAYKLEGFDRDWIWCGNRHTAVYTNLSGGAYEFKVKAANNDDLWNMEGASVRLLVSPPFWKKPWFWLLACLSLPGFIFLVYKYRTDAIRYRNTRLEKINNKLNNEIAERRKVEAALRKSEENFRTIFENSIDIHFRADLNG